MESVGIVMALLGGLAAAPLFCLAVAKIVRPITAIAALCFWASLVVVALFILDIGLVCTRGVLGTRALVGPPFFVVHTVLTLAIAPALTCALLLGSHRFSRHWLPAAIICWCAGAGAIFYQYAVAETLYGIDGMGGPYSSPL